MRPTSTSVEPEVLFPGQDGYGPTRALWVGVLFQACEDRTSRAKRTTEDGEEARRWLLSEDDEVCSFRWVCGVLGLDVEATRRWALNVTKEELTVQRAKCWAVYGS